MTHCLNFFDHIAGSNTVGSYGNTILRFWGTVDTSFVVTSLYSHYPFDSHPCQHLLLILV